MRVVDSHVHIYPPEVISDWEKIGEKEPYFNVLVRGKVHKWATVEDLIAQMDSDGISQSLIFGFAFSDLALCRLCNDYVISAVKRYPDRLKGLAVVPPLVRGAISEIERCRQNGLIGVGELFPEGQDFDLADARETWRLVGACHEMGMFLLVHTAEPVGHDYPGKGNVGPKEAAAFCLNHPEITVIFAHFGGGLWMYELMPEMRLALSNAYYDTAAAPFLYEPQIFKAIEASGLAYKFLYGSDYPILSLNRYKKLFEGIDIGNSVLKSIFSDNFEHVCQDDGLSMKR
ncbi:MAG TPA: amidohydrolase family protein [Acetomicrobium flavidum]|uniref:amidohydrolase family protein n=1 Tax=Acetomicrobium flavidum TaxID=49896 RepID=UPI002CABFC24|nr:amidohydrolase family protein [Acetomicrobium flavidum]HPP14956.1 amidohydrolase family protein [Acetomicrobium flavidum]